MYFEYPHLLWLLAIPVLLAALYIYREWAGKSAHLRVSSLDQWRSGGFSILALMRHVPVVLRTAALVCVVVVIARPRSSYELENIDTEGIDIVLAMDVSTSMLARDFTPDRIGASKEIAIRFVSGRRSDRIGVVVFAGESYTQCPLTSDRAAVMNLIDEIRMELIEDGTAIGNGLATAVGRLKDSDAVSRVVILLTDGVNNRGEISPEMAAEIASTYGIRVYTIGVGANGDAPYPVMTPWGVEMRNIPVEIDEDILKSITEITGGKYFRATDNTKLQEIYNEIDALEKTKVMVDNIPVYKDLYMDWAIAALILLLLEILVRLLIRRLP